MAKVEVGSWVDFLDALQVAENEITLTADLDGNDQPLEESIDVGKNVTIHGEGHTIYNIYPNVPINDNLFRVMSGAWVRVDKCNFYNLYRTERYPFFFSTRIYPERQGLEGWKFSQCNFQGRGPILFSGVLLDRCAINWDLSINGILNSGSENTKKMIINSSYININAKYNESYSVAVIKVISAVYDMDHTYVTGTIDLGTSTKQACLFGSATANDPTISNCINLTSVSDPSRLSVVDINSSSNWTTPLSIYNSDTIKAQTKDADIIVACTEAELKDAKKLYDKGFDIVVS